MPAVPVDRVADFLPARRPDFTVPGPTALIVETRPHPQLPFVVLQMHEMLGLPIHLFHGESNRDFILNSPLAPLVKQKKLILSQLQRDDLSGPVYNALFTSPDFWEHVIGREKILVFQTDAVLCRHAKAMFKDILAFDYIGAGWGRARPEGICVDGGVGGLSLRDWGKTVDCTRRFPAKHWRGGEDTYFGFHIELIGGTVGKGQQPAKFASQYNFRFRSFGAHQMKKLHWAHQLLFLAYCPEAWRIFGPENLAAKRAISGVLRWTGLGRFGARILGLGRSVQDWEP